MVRIDPRDQAHEAGKIFFGLCKLEGVIDGSSIRCPFLRLNGHVGAILDVVEFKIGTRPMQGITFAE